ncbi:MAG: TetR/AcrR family transcriptional regulator [Microcoleus sp.]|uniref:TetR/AcrR family transcriptional regulator n=1 Tax=unclassified Microcoleus TaxID=2642155 RepID=UPI002FD3D860
MPTQTFFNLPEAKRQTIVKLAIAQFASHDYKIASISNIVKQAKIAKGSFYQYFEDKKDLYLYLVDLAHQQKIDFLQQAKPPGLEMGFFPYLRWLFRESAQFDLSHPALSQIINRAVYGDVPFRDEVLKRTQSVSLMYVHGLVKQGIDRGDIDPGIDPDFAAFVISALADGLRDFIPGRLSLNSEQLTEAGVPELDMQVVEQVFDDLIGVLEHGMGRSSDTKL